MTSAIPTAVRLNDGTPMTLTVTAHDLTLTIQAIDDEGHALGVATCDLAPSLHPRSFRIDVVPAMRSRGIGTALFERLLEEAGARGIAWLTFTGPSDDALLRMAATSGSICARRVDGGLAKSVVLVPEPHAG